MSITRTTSDLFINGFIETFDNGDSYLERNLIEYQSREPDIYHPVIEGDTLTYIAWRYYKSLTENPSRYWKYIADVNNIENPMDLNEFIGSPLVVPNFQLIRINE